jgi:hypothetical protein
MAACALREVAKQRSVHGSAKPEAMHCNSVGEQRLEADAYISHSTGSSGWRFVASIREDDSLDPKSLALVRRQRLRETVRVAERGGDVGVGIVGATRAQRL